MDQTPPTISKLLRQLEEHSTQEETVEIGTQSKADFTSIHYYHSYFQLSKRQDDTYVWEDIFKNQHLTSLSQLHQLFSMINNKIQRAKYPHLNDSIIFEEELSMKTYLTHKSLLFHNLLQPTSILEEDYELSHQGFSLVSLKKIAQDLQSIHIKLAALIDQVPVEKRWFLKLMGHLLLHYLSQLIKEVLLAAYSFAPEDQIIQIQSIEVPIKSLQGTSQKINISLQQNQLRLLDKDNKDKLKKFLPKKEYLLFPIGLIQDKITLCQRAEEDILREQAVTSLDGLIAVTFSSNELKCVQLNLQISAFTSKYFHFQCNRHNLLQIVQNIIKEDPFMRQKEQNLTALVPCSENFGIDLQQYQYMYYKIINKIRSQYFHEGTKLNKICLNLLSLLKKCILVSEFSPNRLLCYENYFSVVKIIIADSQLSPSLLKELTFIMKDYSECLNKKTARQKLKLQLELIKIDQNFTYQLLTNSKIVANLMHYEHQITQALQHVRPLIQLTKKIIDLQQHLINGTIEPAIFLAQNSYLSLAQQQANQNKLPQKHLLDQIEQICLKHPQLIKQIPHLNELKSILLLLQILKSSKRKTNNYQQNSHVNFKKLNELANYFSYERKNCKIYQLKSKILLFVTLFKMGHYVPKITEKGQIVNLRQRIINLMAKQANHNVQSKLTTSIIQKPASSSLLVYSNSQNTLNNISNILDGHSPQSLDIQASYQLQQKVSLYVQQLQKKYDQEWVSYITQRLNIMEHELFLEQKKIIKKQEDFLIDQYVEHLRNCLSQSKNFKAAHENEFNALIRIERYFFKQRYEKGWELLQKETIQNPKFPIFLNTLLQSTNQQVQIFKFLKIYKYFERIQTILSPFLADNTTLAEQELLEVMNFINQGSPFEIEEQPILALVEFRLKLKRIKDLQEKTTELFYLSDSVVWEKPQKPQEQIVNSSAVIKKSRAVHSYQRLEALGIKITKKDDKTSIIKIGKEHKHHFNQIKETLKYIVNNSTPGISKVKNVSTQSGKTWSQQLLIEIQSNSTEVPVDQYCNIEQSLIKTFCEKVVQMIRIVLLNSKETNFQLDEAQVLIDSQQKIVEINPYPIILEQILRQQGKLNKKMNMADSLSRIIRPFTHKFSNCFNYNFEMFIKTLGNYPGFTLANISPLFNSSLFLSLPDQISLLIQYQTKMFSIYRQFDVISRLCRSQLQKIDKRLRLFQNPKIKNYAYYFKLASILEEQLIEEEVGFKDNSLQRLAAKTELFGGNNQPMPNSSISMAQFPLAKFSLQEFIRTLKNKIIQSNNKQKTLLEITQKYPKIIHFLHRTLPLLEQKYLDQIIRKTKWLPSLVSLPEKAKNSIKNQISKPTSPEGQRLHTYEQHFQTNLISKLKDIHNRITCPKCLAFLRILQKIDSNSPAPLFEALIEVANLASKATSNKTAPPNILAEQHSNNKCFITEKLQSHPAVQAFGKQIKRPIPQYYLVCNWWFYLQYNYPHLLNRLSLLQARSTFSL